MAHQTSTIVGEQTTARLIGRLMAAEFSGHR